MTSYTPAMRQPCLLILLAKLVSIRSLVSLTERHDFMKNIIKSMT